MASFTPYNVEPDSDTEEEIDDTKEIQVEEALKLYQNALKLHSQGPRYFKQADEAYEALFKSEIFSYPESQSEAKRLEYQDDVESDIEEVDFDPLVVGAGGAETAPNALPQILYLSYKNYGQFLLDRLAQTVAPPVRSDTNQSKTTERSIGAKSLRQFAEALERDGTDLDLWRRAAKLSRLLGSKRLDRFSLETVLNDDIDEDPMLHDAAGLEEGLAKEELEELVSSLRADPSVNGSSITAHQKAPISRSVKKLMDPLTGVDSLPQLQPVLTNPIKTLAIRPTWEDLGEAIASELNCEGLSDPGLAIRIMINVGLNCNSASQESQSARPLKTPETIIKRRRTKDLVISPKKENVNTDPQPTGKSTGPFPDGNNAASATIDTNVNPAKETRADDAEIAIMDGSPIKLSHRNGQPGSATEPRQSLKRNSESAGLPENADGVRVRSKRLRARAEVLDEEHDPKDLERQFEEQLQPFDEADQSLFKTSQDVLHKAGVQSLEDLSHLRQLLFQRPDSNSPGSEPISLIPALDLKEALCQWDMNKSNLLLHGSGSGASVTLIGGGDDSGLTSFLEHSKPGSKDSFTEREQLGEQGIREIAALVNESWTDIESLTLAWLQALLAAPNAAHAEEMRNQISSSQTSPYLKYKWSRTLKEIVTRILVEQDHKVYSFAEKTLTDLGQPLTKIHGGDSLSISRQTLIEFIQTSFELHLDIYGEAIQPNSKVDQPSRMMQRERLRRWARLSNNAIALEDPVDLEAATENRLMLRHLWSSVMYVSVIESASREHVLLCLRDLEATLRKADVSPLQMPNNSALPIISAEAAEAEVSRLTTMDFFMSIFDPNVDKPVDVIESLEPVLITRDQVSNNNISDPDTAEKSNPLSEFLSKATASLRLSLWHRLKMAYQAIEYPPMVFLCNIRSLDVIFEEIHSESYGDDSRESRTANLIVWIRNIADMISQCFELATSNPEALDCMDDAHLPLALRLCSEAIKMFHILALWEDSLRVGQLQAPNQLAGATVPYRRSMDFLRELQPKVWILFYLLIREVILQNRDSFSDAEDVRASLLSAIHRSFGAREYCKLGKKALVKFIKTELLSLSMRESTEGELAQILFDQYELRIDPGWTFEDHGCPTDALDRSTALDIVAYVMLQSQKMSTKDLLKSDIKVATEKMQAVIGIPRSSSAHQAFNKRVILAHLKSPINPMNLYRCLKGIGGLSSMTVTTDFASVANKRWFFLLGQIFLAKYRSQRRMSPDTSDDLDEAVTYFKLDLDFNTENWESWYRLGQAYDSKIEEETTWTAEMINEPKSDLVAWQRNAINCYTTALAVAVRNAGESFEIAAKLTDLYTDFGNRIYASCRAPFSMQVFGLQDHERFCNVDSRTYKREPFHPLRESAAWVFASELFQLALDDREDDWHNWYMLGKCQWKLFHCQGIQIDFQPALDAFQRAIEHVPEKRDSRHPERDTILEPHYKLVSIVHKLVHGKFLSPEDGAKTLQGSSYTRKIQLQDSEQWGPYILSVLKALRSVDKLHWHHRIVARAAHIHYDDNEGDIMNARAAKHELTQQIFTKTMTVQVWKPEFERAGRHFVYNTKYVRFFVKLLFQTGDRASLEGLGKKVRKKQVEFVDHTVVWHEIFLAHMKLLRFQGGVPDGHEDTIFKTLLPYDVFTLNANRLEEWAHSQLALGHATLDLLREIIELKKLNANYVRSPLIDDLIGDTYAKIYAEVVPELVAKADEVENRERMRIDRMLMASDAGGADEATAATPPADQTPAAPTRLKSIGRTEVRKRAEALVARSNAAGALGRARPAVAITTTGAGLKGGDAKETEEPPGGREVAESSPLSLHDSADDESELSDIDEEEEPKVEEEPQPLFPGLKTREDPGPDADTPDVEKEADGSAQDEPEEQEEEDAKEEIKVEDDKLADTNDVEMAEA